MLLVLIEVVRTVGNVCEGIDELANVRCDDVVLRSSVSIKQTESYMISHLFTEAITSQPNPVNHEGTAPKLTCDLTSLAPKLL
jgi:hypothetical protein